MLQTWNRHSCLCWVGSGIFSPCRVIESPHMNRFTLLVFATTLALAQSKRPLVAIGGINHESNTFNPRKTDLTLFTRRDIPADEFLRETAKSNSTTSGFIEGARLYGCDVYPTFDTEAPPLGPVTREAFNSLTAELIASLKSAPRLDGILLFLMGAMVSE